MEDGAKQIEANDQLILVHSIYAICWVVVLVVVVAGDSRSITAPAASARDGSL